MKQLLSMLSMLNPFNWGRKRSDSESEVEEQIETSPKVEVRPWEKLELPSEEQWSEARKAAVKAVPEQTIEPVEGYSMVASRYHELFDQIMSNSQLGIIKTRLQELMTSGKERIAKKYEEAVQTAIRNFEDAVLPHAKQMSEDAIAKAKRIAELIEENINLEQEFKEYTASLTGNPNIAIEAVNNGKLIAISVLVGVIVLLCDVFLGAPAFSFASNDILAYTMSFAFGVSYAAVLYFWSQAKKRMISHDDAEQTLASYKRQNRGNAKVQAMELIPISANEKSTVNNMMVIFSLMSVFMLIARIMVSQESRAMMIAGCFGTFMIVVVSLMGYFVELKIAPPYGKHHDILDGIDAAIEVNRHEIEELQNGEDAEPLWLMHPRNQLQTEFNSAWKNVEDEVNAAHGDRLNYLSLVSQAETLANLTIEQHTGTCLEVAHAILQKKAELDGVNNVDFTFDTKLASGKLALPAINDPFTAQIESGSFNPESLRPSRVAWEPNKLLAAVIANLPKLPEEVKNQGPRINIRKV